MHHDACRFRWLIRETARRAGCATLFAAAAIALSAGAAPPTTQPVMPAAALPEQGDYTFAATDPTWVAQVLYLDPKTGAGILPGDPGDKSGLGRIVNYSEKPDGRSLKELVFSPGGQLLSETDNRMTGSFPQRGDLYRRAFRDDGTLVLYLHMHDGRYVEGYSRSPDDRIERVHGGVGTLSMQDDETHWTHRIFGDGGVELILHLADQTLLMDAAGTATFAADGSFSLRLHDPEYQCLGEWSRDKNGSITILTPPADPKISFLQACESFFTHLCGCVETAGDKSALEEVKRLRASTMNR